MHAGCRRRRAGRSALALSSVVLAVACSDRSPSTLQPAGPGARRVEGLWWLLFWISAAVCAVVIGGVLIVVIRRKRRGEVDQRDPTKFVIIAGVVIPFLVLAIVYGISLRDTLALSRPFGDPGGQQPLTIEVIGHQWWWEVRYPPGTDVVTANEIHVPTDSDVQLRLSTGDVLHSFWVPQLIPKTDLIAGRTNTTWLRADHAGTYRGQCAEYCGMQHAHMAFVVIAQPREDFEAWLADARPAVPPRGDAERRGLQVFMQTGCASCHTIRGTDAGGRVGPDLTTVGDRWSLGAGTIPNDDGGLRAWIHNSQQFKPGNAMPPQQVSPSDMTDLIAYLRSLQPSPRGAP